MRPLKIGFTNQAGPNLSLCSLQERGFVTYYVTSEFVPPPNADPPQAASM